jgi:deoxyribodipyrimidine photo-lyase
MNRALVLFTRDLRVRDNAALAAAAHEADEVLALFVLDRALLAGSCGAPNRLAFLLESLEDLSAALQERGAQLVVRHGDVIEETLRFASEWEVSSICMSADMSPYAQRRQLRLGESCERARIELRLFAGITVVEPGELTPVGGDHYRVFTPYWRVWSELPTPGVQQAPRRIVAPVGLRGTTIPALTTLTCEHRSPGTPRGGEFAGREQLSRWLRGGLARYESLHDDLAAGGTSRLSPYLHFGCLSPASVLARVDGREGGEPLARQLCWRDFHHQVLAARPDLPHADYRSRGDRWRRDRRASEAWRVGRTGCPIVDAGMRQLAVEGFMHNRARLIVASFLTKTLYIDWRLGAAHFAGLLVDADVANNVGNWQWVAGTGNDTRPNRVLNPLRQAHRFDPSGEYVRRYVPELAGIDGGAVHEPWRLAPAVRRRLDYPDPIVDHRSAANELRRRRGAERPSQDSR